MSNIVTFEQAERLEKLGFDESISHYYELEDGKWGITNTLDKNFKDYFIRYPDERSIIRLAPTVSEALDWIRGVKGVACGAYPQFDSYQYVYRSDEKLKYSEEFDTHPLASSALLDAILDHLEKGGEE